MRGFDKADSVDGCELALVHLDADRVRGILHCTPSSFFKVAKSKASELGRCPFGIASVEFYYDLVDAEDEDEEDEECAFVVVVRPVPMTGEQSAELSSENSFSSFHDFDMGREPRRTDRSAVDGARPRARAVASDDGGRGA